MYKVKSKMRDTHSKVFHGVPVQQWAEIFGDSHRTHVEG